MKLIHINLVTLLCIVVHIQSERTRSGVCSGCQPAEAYMRIKRAKYYSSPSQKFYKRPPMSYPIRGAFSYTPPPGYKMDDDERLSPNNRPKVSKHPTNEGLGEEDINNIVKYLSKQDLDKIIEFAGEKERDTPQKNKQSSFENYISSKPDVKKFENNVIYKDSNREGENDQRFSLNGPFVRSNEDFRPYSIEYVIPKENTFQETKSPSITDQEPTALFINKNNVQFNTKLDLGESIQSNQYSDPNMHTHQEVNGNFDTTGINIFTDGDIIQEEQLPKPSNLREDDYDVSNTDNIPTVIRADSDSYKLENFGTLPLMDYHSKLDTVDSYKVPHYTITSPSKYIAPAPISNIKSPPVEHAPPASTAQEQSDAHLKAIKIWTHRSKGTAYTLHDDGTLSLEKTSRSKTNYG